MDNNGVYISISVFNFSFYGVFAPELYQPSISLYNLIFDSSEFSYEIIDIISHAVSGEVIYSNQEGVRVCLELVCFVSYSFFLIIMLSYACMINL